MSDRTTGAGEPPEAPLAAALASCRTAFVTVGCFSGVINVLMLSGPLFMLQVYDRVLPSKSVPTLLGFAALLVVLLSFQGVLDVVRGRMLVRIGRALDERLARMAFEATVKMPLRGRRPADPLQPLRDLDHIRSFLSGPGPTALFDLPWMPIYLGICFLFHPLLGLAALIGAVLLVSFTLLTELRTRQPARAALRQSASRLGLAEAGRRNAEALQAMGMTRRLGSRWEIANDGYMDAQQRASDVAGGLGALSRTLRMMLQSTVLGVGAWLVIQQEATAGIIIVASILASRALAPVELAIAQWKAFLVARQSWTRLSGVLATLGETAPMSLPRPGSELVVENMTVVPPGHQKVVVHDVGFRLEAGQGLGVIGPSASGKSSLARALVGVWRPARGKVRLDGAALDQWSTELLGKHIGYVPQDLDLFDGTVAENIARFEPEPDPAAIVAAAEAAGVHQLILGLPDGYETRIGEDGTALSAGQRQRIALARALYGDPFLVVLDEPNSNLDAEGEQALTQAIVGVRQRNGIVIVIAHRPSALAAVDLLLAIAGGQPQAFGPKDEVLRKVLRPQGPAPVPLKVVAASSLEHA